MLRWVACCRHKITPATIKWTFSHPWDILITSMTIDYINEIISTATQTRSLTSNGNS